MSFDRETLDALFKRAQKGDIDAFERIVSHTEKQIYNTALAILKSREDAEDITQETYLRLWRELPQFRGGSGRAYLFSIARNLSLDLLRKNSRTKIITASDLDVEEDLIATFPDDESARPDISFIRSLERTAVREVLSSLPLWAREMIVLRDIDSLSYKEIAKALSLPIGTVKSRLKRARDLLEAEILKKDIFSQ